MASTKTTKTKKPSTAKTEKVNPMLKVRRYQKWMGYAYYDETPDMYFDDFPACCGLSVLTNLGDGDDDDGYLEEEKDRILKGCSLEEYIESQCQYFTKYYLRPSYMTDDWLERNWKAYYPLTEPPEIPPPPKAGDYEAIYKDKIQNANYRATGVVAAFVTRYKGESARKKKKGQNPDFFNFLVKEKKWKVFMKFVNENSGNEVTVIGTYFPARKAVKSQGLRFA